jgi:hypothetical protein
VLSRFFAPCSIQKLYPTYSESMLTTQKISVGIAAYFFYEFPIDSSKVASEWNSNYLTSVNYIQDNISIRWNSITKKDQVRLIRNVLHKKVTACLLIPEAYGYLYEFVT